MATMANNKALFVTLVNRVPRFETYTQNDYCNPPAHVPRVKNWGSSSAFRYAYTLAQSLCQSRYGMQ